jgi:hypothetical protein
MSTEALTSSARAVLEIPGTPKSLNAVGLYSHWSVGRREKQRWEQDIATALMVAGVPRGLGRVAASAEIRFKQRRRRDEGNFRTIIEKALGDILQTAWGLPDDTPEYYRFGTVDLVAPSPEPLTVLTLDYWR